MLAQHEKSRPRRTGAWLSAPKQRLTTILAADVAGYSRFVHGRACATFRPPVLGRCLSQGGGPGSPHSAAQTARSPGGRVRTGRTHHASPDPPPRRPSRVRSRWSRNRRQRDHADVLCLEGFLTRNGHPHQRLDPKTDPCAQTLIERFHIIARELPIVLCPNGQLLRNPSDVELARCIGLVQPIDPDKIYDVVIIGAGPAGLAASELMWLTGRLAPDFKTNPIFKHSSQPVRAAGSTARG